MLGNSVFSRCVLLTSNMRSGDYQTTGNSMIKKYILPVLAARFSTRLDSRVCSLGLYCAQLQRKAEKCIRIKCRLSVSRSHLSIATSYMNITISLTPMRGGIEYEYCIFPVF